MSQKLVNGGPTVRPLTEGYVVKGGHNPSTSQVQSRPPAPAAIPAPPPAPTPTPTAPSSTGGYRNGKS